MLVASLNMTMFLSLEAPLACRALPSTRAVDEVASSSGRPSGRRSLSACTNNPMRFVLLDTGVEASAVDAVDVMSGECAGAMWDVVGVVDPSILKCVFLDR